MDKPKKIDEINIVNKKYYLVACAGIFGDDGCLFYDNPLLVAAYSAKQAVFLYEKEFGYRNCHDYCKRETMAYYWERWGGKCIREYIIKPDQEQVSKDFHDYCNEHTWGEGMIKAASEASGYYHNKTSDFAENCENFKNIKGGLSNE